MRILLVEDEAEIANFILKGLRAERFAADWAQTAEKGLLFAKTNSYDCAVMDIRLKGEVNGLDILKAAREKEKTFPVIVLSAVRDAEMRVKALNMGADDYLTKPFLFAELLARIRALLRRSPKLAGPVLTARDVALDTLAHAVTCGGRPLTLNRKEFALLEYFMRNPGVVLTRSMILDHVWEAGTDELTNTVDVHVSFLRRKLGKGRHDLIRTVHGCGYKWEG
jgi:DNA-binding response OmpR family regulator